MSNQSDTSDPIVFPGKNRKTHCPQGHPYTESNTSWKINWKGFRCRECKECGKIRMQRKRSNPDYRKNERVKMRRWRAANPKGRREAYKRAYVKRDKWIQDQKKKCKYCPEDRFPCLDFHHRESDEKVATIGQVRHWPQARLAEEIAKCDVVCANCHRWLHYVEKQNR